MFLCCTCLCMWACTYQGHIWSSGDGLDNWMAYSFYDVSLRDGIQAVRLNCNPLYPFRVLSLDPKTFLI